MRFGKPWSGNPKKEYFTSRVIPHKLLWYIFHVYAWVIDLTHISVNILTYQFHQNLRSASRFKILVKWREWRYTISANHAIPLRPHHSRHCGVISQHSERRTLQNTQSHGRKGEQRTGRQRSSLCSERWLYYQNAINVLPSLHLQYNATLPERPRCVKRHGKSLPRPRHRSNQHSKRIHPKMTVVT